MLKNVTLGSPTHRADKIGRLQKKHPRVARFYTLVHEGGTLSATCNDDKHRHAADLCDDYVLKVGQSLSAPQTWSLYKKLRID